jgi:hypothetical protein
LLTSATFTSATTVAGDDEGEIEIGYDAQFSRLVHARREVEDPFPEIADPSAFFVQSLHRLLSSRQGQLLPLIQEGMSSDPKLYSGLDAMFRNAGLALM